MGDRMGKPVKFHGLGLQTWKACTVEVWSGLGDKYYKPNAFLKLESSNTTG